MFKRPSHRHPLYLLAFTDLDYIDMELYAAVAKGHGPDTALPLVPLCDIARCHSFRAGWVVLKVPRPGKVPDCMQAALHSTQFETKGT